jgi:HSP20 family protein
MEAYMANLRRYDPFSAGLDDLFKGLVLKPMHFDMDFPEQVQIRMDVTRSDGAYLVKAEIPGVKKDDINVTIDGNQVTVSGEVKKDTEEKKGEEIIRSERYYGKVTRSFTLPQDIDQSRVIAKYSDGVLDLTLPTKEKATAKKIAIG